MLIENGEEIFDDFLNLKWNICTRRLWNVRGWLENIFEELSYEVSVYSPLNFDPKTEFCNSVM
jgi:hypothetical protein